MTRQYPKWYDPVTSRRPRRLPMGSGEEVLMPADDEAGGERGAGWADALRGGAPLRGSSACPSPHRPDRFANT